MTPNPYGRLLALMRAAQMAHWTIHWTLSGTPFYGDHLLFERLYTGISDEIDALGEKTVNMEGAGSVNLPTQLSWMLEFAAAWDRIPNLIMRGERIEIDIQNALIETKASLTASGTLTLGMDNFLAGLADAHETNKYLLQQRSMAQKVASRHLAK